MSKLLLNYSLCLILGHMDDEMGRSQDRVDQGIVKEELEKDEPASKQAEEITLQPI